MQFRLDYDFKRLFSDLFSNSRMLGASSTANLVRHSQQESSSSAGASGSVGSSQPAHAAESVSAAESAKQEQLWAVGLDLDYDDSSDDSDSESAEEEQPPSPAAGSRQRTSGSGGGNGCAAEDAAATLVVDVQTSVRNGDGTDGAAAGVQPSNAALDPGVHSFSAVYSPCQVASGPIGSVPCRPDMLHIKWRCGSSSRPCANAAWTPL